MIIKIKKCQKIMKIMQNKNINFTNNTLTIKKKIFKSINKDKKSKNKMKTYPYNNLKIKFLQI